MDNLLKNRSSFVAGRRVWEVDFLRGLALLLMIVFHLIWDLNEFYDYPLDYSQGFIALIGTVAAYLFILLTGISCTFSSNNPKRAARILLAAVLITVATYLYDPGSFIAFGILHLLGVCVLLYPLVKNLSQLLLFVYGLLSIAIGRFFLQLSIRTNLLLVFGLRNADYYSLDYYPLFPYFGLFLFGVAIAKRYYLSKTSLFSRQLPANPISFFGRHTLVVYLLHQPLIMVTLRFLSAKALI